MIWCGLGLGILALLRHRFRFTHPTARSRRRKKLLLPDETTEWAVPAMVPAAVRTTGVAARLRQTLTIARRSWEEVANSRLTLAVVLGLLFMVGVAGWEIGDTVFCDLDGDGDLDIIAGNEASTNRIYANKCNSTCIQNTSGAELAASLHKERIARTFNKGTHPKIDSTLKLTARGLDQIGRRSHCLHCAHCWHLCVGADLGIDCRFAVHQSDLDDQFVLADMWRVGNCCDSNLE